MCGFHSCTAVCFMSVSDNQAADRMDLQSSADQLLGAGRCGVCLEQVGVGCDPTGR